MTGKPAPRPSTIACAMLTTLACVPAGAVDPLALDTVRVFGHRQTLSDFPGAVTVIEGAVLRDGQRRVDLSESLSQVPGITVRDRQNHAQDLQIQSRGFGARSTFGIRGLRLVVDGVPATASDGQGQAANFALDALDRVEVLRGPLALQYGNAAGGAIIGYTELDDESFAAADAWGGNHDSARLSARVQGGGSAEGQWRWRLHGSDFRTAGERAHSRARRVMGGVAAEVAPREGQRLKVVFDLLHQPQSQDPLGLTRQAWREQRSATDAAAVEFDTRKRIDQRQMGVRWELAGDERGNVWVGGYAIDRNVEQFLAVPIAVQRAATHAGGVIDLQRRSRGVEWGHRWQYGGAALAIGMEASRTDETRRGYESFLGGQTGVRGRLRRDERNRIVATDAFAVGERRLGTQWNALAGVRASRLHFLSRDRYIVPGNGDDSGELNFRQWAGSLGVSRRLAHGEVFASAGRGFETPTMTELAYSPDGSAGLNRGLLAAQHHSLEAGMRQRGEDGHWSLAAYRVDGRDEIVPADSRGGRASFTNAGRTRRIGIEAGASGALAEGWNYQLSVNALRATFVEPFAYVAATARREVAAGNRLPGVPQLDGQLSLRRMFADQWTALVELRGSRRVPVDDRNTDGAPGFVRVGLRWLWRADQPGWHGFVAVDNVFDRRFVGSVIVNEANARYFEPGAGRTFTLGVGWRSGR